MLAGHAYAGAVIGAARSDKVKALVYVAALAPDEGETVADMFYRGTPHPAGAQARAGRAWVDLSARSGLRRRLRAKCLERRTGGAGGGSAADLARLHHGQGGAAVMEGPAGLVPGRRAGPHDRRGQSPLHGRADEGSNSFASCRPHAPRDRALNRRRHHPRGDRPRSPKADGLAITAIRPASDLRFGPASHCLSRIFSGGAGKKEKERSCELAYPLSLEGHSVQGRS